MSGRDSIAETPRDYPAAMDEPFFPAEFARSYEPEMGRMLACAADVSESIGGGVMARGHPGTWCNHAIGLGLDGPVPEAEVDRLVAFYSDHGIEPRIELCATADPLFIRALADRGFVVRSFEHVLARRFRGPEPAPPHALVDGLAFEQVDTTDRSAVRAAVMQMMKQFYPKPGDGPSEESVELTVKFSMGPGVHLLVARVDGVFAGSGGMQRTGVFANIIGAGVVPEFRRRGIQQHLIARRCEIARSVGAEIAVVGSKPGISTERNAMRMGFALVYTRTVLVMPGDGLVPEHTGD